MARIQSTTAAGENCQCTSTDVNDILMHPPDPSPPPDRPANAPNEPQSSELEGEKRPWVSSNETSPNDDTHVSGTSGHVEGADDVLKKLRNGSECVPKCSKQKNKYHLGGLETSWQ